MPDSLEEREQRAIVLARLLESNSGDIRSKAQTEVVARPFMFGNDSNGWAIDVTIHRVWHFGRWKLMRRRTDPIYIFISGNGMFRVSPTYKLLSGGPDIGYFDAKQLFDWWKTYVGSAFPVPEAQVRELEATASPSLS